jgi:hypothetical protein
MSDETTDHMAGGLRKAAVEEAFVIEEVARAAREMPEGPSTSSDEPLPSLFYGNGGTVSQFPIACGIGAAEG